jgi:alpha-glucosidase
MGHWWEDAVFYQIYPRSFMDSNGDGIGDLAGIESRLDYLVELGIDALWICPFFPSPMMDCGYDVADYRNVDPRHGDLAGFTRLCCQAKKRGIRVVLDLVANHSSDEHPWFTAARSSRMSPMHDWYIWVPDTGRPPNNWKACFELGTAWHRNAATEERYLGTFHRHAPEFDWHNPAVRRAFHDVMRFWFDLGVDGFRLDVATAYAKDARLRSNPLSLNVVPDFFQRHLYDRNGPEIHRYFREMRAVADAAGERLLIAEPYGRDPRLAASCCGEGDDELHMAFDFEFTDCPWSARAFRGAAERWYRALPEDAWPCFTLSNHDLPRHTWRYGRGHRRGIGEARARVAAAMLLTLRGTPFLYYGEEIGMVCRRIPRRRLVDPVGIRTWPLGFVGRDPERTPMQWDSSTNAGFSSAHPWLPVNPDYRERNVSAQSSDPGSLLSWYRRLTHLRRGRPELREGPIRFLDGDPDVMAWERDGSSGTRGILVLLNFSSRQRQARTPLPAAVLVGTHRAEGSRLPAGALSLAPLEVVVAEALK